VGVSASPHRRMAKHRNPTKRNNSHVARAVRKNGKESFTMTILSTHNNHTEAFSEERRQIRLRDSVDSGYNLSYGGGSGVLPHFYLRGERFGKLIVVGDTGRRTQSHTVLWECICDCGNTVTMSTSSLHNVGGHRSSDASCGCNYLSKTSPAAKTHDMTGTPTYFSWAAMKKRCINPNASDYKYYGGVGIGIGVWAEFNQFFIDMGERPASRILCRKDSKKDFSKHNCFWGTRGDVARDTKRTKHLTALGETKSMADWSRDLRVSASYTTIRARKNILGWDDLSALGLNNA